MVKRIKIVSELEKQNIMSFLLTNHYPRGCSSKEKRSIKSKAKNLEVEEGLLFTVEEGTRKRYLCDSETQQVKQILSDAHEPGHLVINNLNKQVSRNYAGISFSAIKTFVGSCISCQRET